MPIANIETELLAALFGVLVAALIAATQKIYFLRKEKKALTRKVTELEKQVVASEDHRKEHLNVALQNYREDVDRNKKEVVEAKAIHMNAWSYIRYLTALLNAVKPGWDKTAEPPPPEDKLPVFKDL